MNTLLAQKTKKSTMRPQGIMTQKKLAELANVSSVTIYNSLYRKKLVKPETRKKIYALMEEYDYHPDGIARAMVTNKTNVIGIIVPNFEVAYYAKIASAIERAVKANGCHCIICQHHDDPAKEKAEIDIMREYRVDGIILRNCGSNTDDAQIKRLAKADIPFVLMDGRCEGFDDHYIGYDDYTGVLEAVKHLVKKGHTRIGCIGLHRSGDIKQSDRYKGYISALKMHDIPIDDALVKNCPTEYDSGIEEVLTIFEECKNNPPSAFITLNDHTAYRVLVGAKRINKKVDVVGFGGYFDQIMLPDNFMSIEQDTEVLAKQAVSMLFKQINKEESNGPCLVKCALSNCK